MTSKQTLPIARGKCSAGDPTEISSKYQKPNTVNGLILDQINFGSRPVENFLDRLNFGSQRGAFFHSRSTLHRTLPLWLESTEKSDGVRTDRSRVLGGRSREKGRANRSGRKRKEARFTAPGRKGKQGPSRISTLPTHECCAKSQRGLQGRRGLRLGGLSNPSLARRAG